MKNGTLRRVLAGSVLCAHVFAALAASEAEVPGTILHQGRSCDSESQPVNQNFNGTTYPIVKFTSATSGGDSRLL